VDTTGAGDCFNAGLITGLLRGLDLPQAAALGCAVGATSTQAMGGTGAALDLAAAMTAAAAASINFRPLSLPAEPE
jgi:sugar/nucleoside kinase (ribokinase family)